MYNQNFAKGGGLEVKIFCLKNALIGWPEQSGATQSCHVHGDLGVKPMSLGDFLIFREKTTSLFQHHLDYILHVFEAI